MTEDQKISLVVAYLNDVGDVWYQGWSQVREDCNWEEFVIREKRTMDIVEEFNKMKQHGSVQEYQLQFEELKSLMLSRNPYMTKDYFVSSFLSGLNEKLRSAVKMTRPRTVQEAMESALLQEMNVEAMMKVQRSQARGHGFVPTPTVERGTIRETYKTGPIPKLPAPPTNAMQQGGRMMEPKRPPGLCYKCRDKYYPGHRYGRQLLLLEGGEVEEDAREEILVTGEEGDEEDNGTISLHAIKGVASSKIIKVEGVPHGVDRQWEHPQLHRRRNRKEDEV